MTNLIIFGASRGLGSAFSAGLAGRGDTVWLVSRTQPDTLARDDGVRRKWIAADLSQPEQTAELITAALRSNTLDLLVYNAGIWESHAFEDSYRFEDVPDADTSRIVTVNLTAAMICIRALLPNLRKSENAKIVLIGSTSGLENIGGREVAYTATKFGLRGVAHSLRDNLRADGIAVTCINPGDIAAEMSWDDGPEAAISQYNGTRIPVHDLVAIVKCLMSLSKVSCVKEIDIPAITDFNA